MSEPLDIQQLDDRSRRLARIYAERKGEIEALRTRIEEGWAKVDAATAAKGDVEKVERAKAKLAELEKDLVLKERAIELPWYFESTFLTIMRDALKWVGVPEGSRMRVMLPGVIDLTVRLDNVKDEIPF